MTAERKGISFTMTLAVTGLLLLVTAVVVASFGTTGITQFFKDITGTQGDKVDTYEVRQACEDLANQINEQYCDRYMPSLEYPEEATDINGHGLNGGQCEDGDSPAEGAFCNPDSYDGNAWVQRDKSDACITDIGETEPDRLLGSLELANDTFDRYAYGKTGSQLNCEWDKSGIKNALFGFGGAPTVEVEGNTYNCLERNHISPTCPPTE